MRLKFITVFGISLFFLFVVIAQLNQAVQAEECPLSCPISEPITGPTDNPSETPTPTNTPTDTPTITPSEIPTPTESCHTNSYSYTHSNWRFCYLRESNLSILLVFLPIIKNTQNQRLMSL